MLLTVQNLVQHLPKEVTFKPVDYLPGVTGNNVDSPVPPPRKAVNNPQRTAKNVQKASAVTTAATGPKPDNVPESLIPPKDATNAKAGIPV